MSIASEQSAVALKIDPLYCDDVVQLQKVFTGKRVKV